METHDWKITVEYSLDGGSLGSFDISIKMAWEDNVKAHVQEIGRKGVVYNRTFIPPHRIHEISFVEAD